MKVLKKFEFRGPVGVGATYDWDKILSDEIVQLEEGKDYECKTQTIRMMASKQARKRGKTLRANVVEGGIVLQSAPASKEQLKAWKEQDEAAAEKNGEAEEASE